MSEGTVRILIHKLLSVAVSGFLLFSVLAVYLDLVEQSFLLPALATLASGVSLAYAFSYHRFSRSFFKAIANMSLTITFVVSGTLAFLEIRSAFSLQGLRRVLNTDTFQIGANEFLPEWWIVGLLLPAAILIFTGALVTIDFEPYPKPRRIRVLAMSPVYYGLISGIFGLWAVLFVGIALQRVIVIAPFFEELLKFGVALLIGSTLFGRSLLARIGIAIVVGSAFGLVEHATTYPNETDLVYLHRTLFHTMTTVLSVSIYSLFESTEENRLRWLAPAYSILLHFFYNTFAVLSTLITTVVLDAETLNLSLYYGIGVFIIATILLLATIVHHRIIVAIHRPLAYVLSDLA